MSIIATKYGLGKHFLTLNPTEMVSYFRVSLIVGNVDDERKVVC
jgi:hypothetical protein